MLENIVLKIISTHSLTSLASLLFIQKRFHGQPVAVEPESSYHPFASAANHGFVAEIFTCIHIADMHLNDRTFQRADAILQGYAGVGIGTGIQHDAVVTESHLLHLVDQFTLDVALVIVKLHLRVA